MSINRRDLVMAGAAAAPLALIGGAAMAQAAGLGPLASVGQPVSIPAGFLGLSHEWGQAQMMLGDPRIGVNQPYRRLLANLMRPGAGPLMLRIGGSTTDRTKDHDEATIRPLAQLYRDMARVGDGVTFVPGVNMGANDPALAARQADVILTHMPQGAVPLIEMGNQPDFFVLNGYRPDSYSFANYIEEFGRFAGEIRAARPDAPPFMAPSMGGYAGIPPVPLAPLTNFGTPQEVARLLERHGEAIGVVSHHAYTGGSSVSGDRPFSGMLLTPEAVWQDPVPAEAYVAVSRAAGKPYRMAEMNTIMASGEAGVSDAFEAALWMIDIAFEYAIRGVAGFNLHSNTWNTIHGWEIYGAFTFDVPRRQYEGSKTEAVPPEGTAFPEDYRLRKVFPIYYGLLVLAEAIGGGAELTRLSAPGDVKAWRLRGADGSERIVLLNKSKSEPASVTVATEAAGAELRRLLAPAFDATEGVTWAGQTFDGSTDGQPRGEPVVETVAAASGRVAVDLPAASLALLTLG